MRARSGSGSAHNVVVLNVRGEHSACLNTSCNIGKARSHQRRSLARLARHSHTFPSLLTTRSNLLYIDSKDTLEHPPCAPALPLFDQNDLTGSPPADTPQQAAGAHGPPFSLRRHSRAAPHTRTPPSARPCRLVRQSLYARAGAGLPTCMTGRPRERIPGEPIVSSSLPLVEPSTMIGPPSSDGCTARAPGVSDDMCIIWPAFASSGSDANGARRKPHGTMCRLHTQYAATLVTKARMPS